MKRIKILMLHLGYGGTEKQTITMANALAGKYNIEIISFYKLMESPAYDIDKRIKIKYLYNGKPNREEFKEYLKSKKIIKAFIEGLKALKILHLKRKLIKKEIKLNDADIYFSTRTEYGKLLSKYGTKDKTKITQEHNFIEDEKYKKYIVRNYKKLTYVIVINKCQEKMYQEWFQNTKVKIRRIENILNSNSDKVSKLNNNAIIAVGRLDPIKDFSTLIYIMSLVVKKNPKLKLYLLGDGEEERYLKNKIKEYGLEKNIIMPGFVNAKEVTKYMLKSDMYIMTSKKESFSLVIVEAFNCGLPTISFDIPVGPRELIKNDYNGILISDRDSKKMADKILELINNKEKLKELGKSARKDSEKYLANKVIKKWLDILK